MVEEEEKDPKVKEENEKPSIKNQVQLEIIELNEENKEKEVVSATQVLKIALPAEKIVEQGPLNEKCRNDP